MCGGLEDMVAVGEFVESLLKFLFHQQHNSSAKQFQTLQLY